MPSANRPADICYAIFDFDGVVADTEPYYLELDRATLRHFGYDPTDAEVRSFIGNPSEVAAPLLLAEHGIHVTTDEWKAVWNPAETIYGNPSLEPSPGLSELWRELDARGVKIGVASTSFCADLVRALNHFGLLRYVSALVAREHVEHRKPAPDPYLRALAWLAPGNDETVAGAGVDAGVDAGEHSVNAHASDPEAAAHTVVIEDSPTGIAAAHAAGLYVIGYEGAASTTGTPTADESVPTFAALLASL